MIMVDDWFGHQGYFQIEPYEQETVGRFGIFYILCIAYCQTQTTFSAQVLQRFISTRLMLDRRLDQLVKYSYNRFEILELGPIYMQCLTRLDGGDVREQKGDSELYKMSVWLRGIPNLA